MGQKSGGGAKKYGRDAGKCTKYKNSGRREKAKIANFIEHNIPKTLDIDDKERISLISSFTAIQNSRKKKVGK